MNDNKIWCVRTSPREGPLQRPPPESFDELGSLSNDNSDSNGNEKSKKVIGLDLQNNNYARASRFLVPFFAFVARLHYNVRVPNFTFCRGSEHKTIPFVFFFWTLITSFRIQLQKNLPTFDELNEMGYAR